MPPGWMDVSVVPFNSLLPLEQAQLARFSG